MNCVVDVARWSFLLCVPFFTVFLSGQQTETSLARAHERIKELEVGLTVFVGEEGGGMGADRVVIWERGKGVYVRMCVCLRIIPVYERTVTVTFLVNMQTYMLAPCH